MKTLEKLKSGQPVTIVVIGDSCNIPTMLTLGRKTWIELLHEALWAQYGDGLVAMMNSCRCGEGYRQLAPDLERLVLRFEPDLVVNTVVMNASRPDDDPESDFARGKAICERMQSSGAELLFVTHNPVVWGFFDPRPPDATPGEAYVNSPIRGENCAMAMRRLAAALGCPVCDQYALWKAHKKTFAHPGANPQNLAMRMVDSIHPGPTGHLALFRGIAPYFGVSKFFPWEEVDA